MRSGSWAPGPARVSSTTRSSWPGRSGRSTASSSTWAVAVVSPGSRSLFEFPEATGCLLDAQQRRCAFLEQAIARLGLGHRVTVACGRAEALARDPVLRHGFDLVVARSFVRPAVTAECAAGFLRSGGSLVVTEPPDSQSSGPRWPAAGLAVLGFGSAERVRRGETAAVRMRLVETADDRYPRREGIPAKRPLW